MLLHYNAIKTLEPAKRRPVVRKQLMIMNLGTATEALVFGIRTKVGSSLGGRTPGLAVADCSWPSGPAHRNMTRRSRGGAPY